MSREYDFLTDTELVDLLKSGDQIAFDQIYARYFSSLYTYAYKILQDRDECQDAIQDIFIWIWEHKEKIEIDSLKNYLIASVKYKLVRSIKTSKRHAEILSSKVPSTNITIQEPDVEIKELKKVIADALSLLPTRAKEVFSLSRSQYLSNKEIASKLGISEKTVENHITLSLRRLRAELGKMMSFFFW
jgi:RNA polymerase sigma-70 factor (ECF subfamily)